MPDARGASESTAGRPHSRGAFGYRGSEFVTHEVAQLENYRIADRVEDVQTFFPATDHFSPGKDAKVLGDVGLGRISRFDNLSHRELAGLDRMEDAQAHRLGEHFEAAGDEFQQLGGNLIADSGWFLCGHCCYIAR